MRGTISPGALAGAAVAVLAGGVLLLPLWLALFWVLVQRQEELRRGELEDAKNY